MIDINLCSKDDCVIVHYHFLNDKILYFVQKPNKKNSYENTYSIKSNFNLKNWHEYWIQDFIRNNKKTYIKIYDIDENILSSWIDEFGDK